ncbi:hypothetical protein K488DRAFT_74652 [Vararia minispora EC-137]|uniref:Uncharacterized protein n=1 Tax=Vararia minispora EC-137 TaxID=1314806 RepID=A0ACB8Q722_9AGAM|nr:hypothetical protein K488DRAFT_74652 [Vararia minispora EC-137]
MTPDAPDNGRAPLITAVRTIRSRPELSGAVRTSGVPRPFDPFCASPKTNHSALTLLELFREGVHNKIQDERYTGIQNRRARDRRRDMREMALAAGATLLGSAKESVAASETGVSVVVAVDSADVVAAVDAAFVGVATSLVAIGQISEMIGYLMGYPDPPALAKGRWSSTRAHTHAGVDRNPKRDTKFPSLTGTCRVVVAAPSIAAVPVGSSCGSLWLRLLAVPTFCGAGAAQHSPAKSTGKSSPSLLSLPPKVHAKGEKVSVPEATFVLQRGNTLWTDVGGKEAKCQPGHQ